MLRAAGVEPSGEDQTPKTEPVGNDKGEEFSRMPAVVYNCVSIQAMREMVGSIKLPVKDSKGKFYSKADLAELHRSYRIKFNSLVDKNKFITKQQLSQLRSEVKADLIRKKQSKAKKSKIICEQSATEDLISESRELFLGLLRQTRKALLAEKPNYGHGWTTSEGERVFPANSLLLKKGSLNKKKKKKKQKKEKKKLVRQISITSSTTQGASLEELCKGDDWRKTYVPTLNKVVFFNEKTNEILAGPPQESDVEVVLTNNPVKEDKQPSSGNVIEIDDTVDSSCSSVKPGWPCPACTFFNEQGDVKCKICRHANPLVKSSSGGSKVAGKTKPAQPASKRSNKNKNKKPEPTGNPFVNSKRRKVVHVG